MGVLSGRRQVQGEGTGALPRVSLVSRALLSHILASLGASRTQLAAQDP